MHQWKLRPPRVRGANEEKCSVVLILTNNEDLLGDVMVKGSLGCRSHKTVEFIIQSKGRRVKRWLFWISGEQTLPSSEICFEESCGIMPWMEEGPEKVGWYLRITSSKLKSSPYHQVGSQIKMPGGLPVWTRSSWPNSNTTVKHIVDGSKDR